MVTRPVPAGPAGFVRGSPCPLGLRVGVAWALVDGGQEQGDMDSALVGQGLHQATFRAENVRDSLKR